MEAKPGPFVDRVNRFDELFVMLTVPLGASVKVAVERPSVTPPEPGAIERLPVKVSVRPVASGMKLVAPVLEMVTVSTL